MLRIGLLTSGGDCQALNATMRGIVKTLMTNSEEPIEDRKSTRLNSSH